MFKLVNKIFIYLVLMLFVISNASAESVSADSELDYEEGVANLNNTPENSAKIGSLLLKPEKGWKRYDGNSSKIIIDNPKNHYDIKQGVYHNGMSSFYKKGSTATFYFSGTEFRIIGSIYSFRSTSIEVSIDDNVVDVFSQNIASQNKNETQRLTYEKNNLSSKKHKVVIKNLDEKQPFEIDAIDVDGFLLENEIPSVGSIILDKNVLNLIEGSKDKLITTVTPDTSEVIWISSDESIATVDQNGNVTAISQGEAIITAKLKNTDLVATCVVIVTITNNEYTNAILSITLVNGITKEYDVSNKVLTDYLSWFESAQGTSTFKFSKKISPYKKVAEYLVHDKVASFEIREY